MTIIDTFILFRDLLCLDLLITHLSGALMAENKSNMKGRVTVYSVLGCPHCIQAKITLKKLGLPVCEVDVNKHRELQTQVKRLTGHSSVPQIFFNNVYVGNNEDLQNLVSLTHHFYSVLSFF